MDQAKIKKIKPCIVKLNRLNKEDPEIIRDRILDKRTRKCRVLLRRFDVSKLLETSVSAVYGQNTVRRCCVRLPKLNLSVSECSTPVVLSECDIMSETGDRI